MKGNNFSALPRQEKHQWCVENPRKVDNDGINTENDYIARQQCHPVCMTGYLVIVCNVLLSCHWGVDGPSVPKSIVKANHNEQLDHLMTCVKSAVYNYQTCWKVGTKRTFYCWPLLVGCSISVGCGPPIHSCKYRPQSS